MGFLLLTGKAPFYVADAEFLYGQAEVEDFLFL